MSRSLSRSRTRSPPPNPSRLPPPSTTTIDRSTTTPFLLNFCYRSSAFHNLTDFPVPVPSPANPSPPLPSHLQIYTWMSCTLGELAHLLTSALPGVLPEDGKVGTRLGFRLVYPDLRSGTGGGGLGGGRLDGEGGKGRWVSREMGSVVVGAAGEGLNGNGAGGGFDLKGEDANKTLEEARFVIGDYVDCAVFPPLSDGSVMSRASVMGPRGRENGFGGGGRGRGGFGGGAGSAGGGRGRGDMGANVPSGEWRRGERLPDGGYRGGYGGRGRGRY